MKIYLIDKIKKKSSMLDGLLMDEMGTVFYILCFLVVVSY